MKKWLEKLIDAIRELWEKHKPTQPVDPDTPAPQPVGPVTKWDKATHASCWQGSNAQTRHMNMLSFNMPETEFMRRLAWMKSIGCNTVHWFITNQGDGEYAGYCIYGKTFSWKVDKGVVATMRLRIEEARRQGFAVVLWLMADDSSTFAKAAATNFNQYLVDLRGNKLLDECSIIVAGLELDEYYDRSKVAALITAIKAVWSGPVGTHEASGYKFANLSDICFYQVNPGMPAAQITAEANKVVRATGKPVNFFELSRSPSRALCEAAFNGGAYAVGNWDK